MSRQVTSGLSEGGKAGVKQRPKERQAVGAPGQTPDHREMEGVGSVSLIPASRPPDLGKGGRFGIEGCIPASPTHPSLDLGLMLSDILPTPHTRMQALPHLCLPEARVRVFIFPQPLFLLPCPTRCLPSSSLYLLYCSFILPLFPNCGNACVHQPLCADREIPLLQEQK